MKRMLLSVGIAAVLGIGGAQAAGDAQAGKARLLHARGAMERTVKGFRRILH